MEQLHQRRFAAVCLLTILMNVGSSTPSSINVTLIENAVERGAVCLYGSPGGYYFDSGFGEGATKWIVYLKGGGWCNDTKSCLDRTKSDLGSSTSVKPVDSFSTLTSSNQTINPDFYNWNRVVVVYCDGASFMADVEEVDPETKLYLRGGRIFRAIMEELTLTKGMIFATEALLAGNSAGGLATILNCDRFWSYLPLTCRVKCLSDSGFFIHAPDIPGTIDRVNYFSSITTFHNLEQLLPQSCTSRLPPSLCLFPEYVIDNIDTPLFLINSVYDAYQSAGTEEVYRTVEMKFRARLITLQVNVNVVPNLVDYQGWANCTKQFENVKTCTPRQFQLILDFGKAFINTLEALDDCPSRGLFINSCYIHGFIYRPSFWRGYPVLENKTVADAIADWYFERSTSVQLVDTEHPYPINCNTTTN